ncbi:MAG TPA: AAA family ATPase [Acidobacteriota bacterium]|nr:AAA family ATPase [Acidobacteriota bacterium]
MTLSTTIHELRTLVVSFHPLIVVETVDEDRVQSLLISVAAELQIAHFEWSVTRGLSRLPGGSPTYGTAEPAQLLRHLACMDLEGVFHLKDFQAFLQDATIVRQFRELLRKFSGKKSAIVLTGAEVELPPEIESEAAHFKLRMPGKEELRDVVRSVLTSLQASNRIRINIQPDDIDNLLHSLSGMTVNQARQSIAYVALQDGKFDRDDIKRILERKIQSIREGGLLEYFPVEDNQFELAGFDRLKEWVRRVRIGFTPEARTLNLPPPKGLLIAGVQGCGKSLCVKYIAREWRLPLLKLEAGRLYDKYVGESEKNFRKAITSAESLAPVVLWIDELEKALAGSANSEADGGLSRRLLGFFLTWLQEKRQDVFVAATANDVWSLPPELLRKGRFDEIFFVDLPRAAERTEIFRLHLRLRKQDPNRFDLQRLTEASEGFSGAEIEQALVAALYRALYEKKTLDTLLILREIEGTVPLSISRREDIERLRRTAEGRFVKAS